MGEIRVFKQQVSGATTTLTELVGYRTIDGSRVAVVKSGASYYAALPHVVKKA